MHKSTAKKISRPFSEPKQKRFTRRKIVIGMRIYVPRKKNASARLLKTHMVHHLALLRLITKNLQLHSLTNQNYDIFISLQNQDYHDFPALGTSRAAFRALIG